jgi:WbqC-like protein family
MRAASGSLGRMTGMETIGELCGAAPQLTMANAGGVGADRSPATRRISSKRSRSRYTIAVMQPYFIPYAGYFRLFAASDLFVVYDCVQFPRRGWVHRNRLPDRSGALRWLTLPLERAPREVLIRDLRFAPEAKLLVAQRLRSFDLATARADARLLVDAVERVEGTPVEYIVETLRVAIKCLGLRGDMIRSSSLRVPASLRGQDRILEIARRVGAGRYINAPGGRALYEPAAFEEAGIELRFLPEYPGAATSILSRLAGEDSGAVAEEIRKSTAPCRGRSR